jgi:tetratricopeptide (TPR) repeat protein
LTTLAVTLLLLALISCKKSPSPEEIPTLLSARTLGLAWLEESNYEDARGAFQTVIDMAPDEALGYANIGIIEMRLSKYEEAERYFRQALEREPDEPSVKLNLAELYFQSDRSEEAVTLLEESMQTTPGHAPSLFRLGQFYMEPGASNLLEKAIPFFSKVVELQPANPMARLYLIEALLRAERGQEAQTHLEAIARILPELQPDARSFHEAALAQIRSNQQGAALSSAIILHNLLKATPFYSAGVTALRGSSGTLMGFTVTDFSPAISTPASQEGHAAEAINFVDITQSLGIAFPAEGEEEPVLAVADYDHDGDQDIYWTKGAGEFLLLNDSTGFRNILADNALSSNSAVNHAWFADYDNDGFLDLLLSGEKDSRLFRNVGVGQFEDVTESAGLNTISPSSKSLFADFDHDGDIDIYILNQSRNVFLRNNLDGTFQKIEPQQNLAVETRGSIDGAFADFDNDGDLDLYLVNTNGNDALYTNLRQGYFADIADSAGLGGLTGFVSVAAGDVDNDGAIDLLLTGEGTKLFLNNGDGTYRAGDDILPVQPTFAANDAGFLDFDNDGFLDIIFSGQEGLRLLLNDRKAGFQDISTKLPEVGAACYQTIPFDIDNDGDQDLAVSTEAGLRIFRNDGGNANRYLKLQLVGVRTGSGKNNHFGIGSMLEVGAGDLYQMRVVSEPVMHIGLGHREKADVVRVIWPNGTPQNMINLESDQFFVEEQVLKGSCAFLYAWNGERFELVTDVLWRSALGMPLGIMGGETQYAFANASSDYFKLPGDAVLPRDGKYTIQITEELWETAYVDKLQLFTVAHPDSVDIFVDETFIPPPIPPLDVYTTSEMRRPVSAVDETGKDVLPFIVAPDEIYLGDFSSDIFQGTTRLHDLILDLGDLRGEETIRLFLHGWFFPSDASINVAVAQMSNFKSVFPYLQVRNSEGEWQTVIPNMSFPMGKSKHQVIDLSGKFLTGDYRIRIRTTLEIYWDHIFFSTEGKKHDFEFTELAMERADLHFRGFSRSYRKSENGPHWFDYNDVTTEQKWRDLLGSYTRFGDVKSLLKESDDMYVIMNAGDEITIDFDAGSARPLPEGWRRDFIIYTDGWVKDGDLNTAHGRTVEPLPFQSMSSYPYGDDEAYPDDPEHREYLRKYNTRVVTTERFKSEIRESVD